MMRGSPAVLRDDALYLYMYMYMNPAVLKQSAE
jgi:hypothetical protein